MPQFYEIIRTGWNHFQNLPQFFEIIRTGSNHFQNLPQFLTIWKLGQVLEPHWAASEKWGQVVSWGNMLPHQELMVNSDFCEMLLKMHQMATVTCQYRVYSCLLNSYNEFYKEKKRIKKIWIIGFFRKMHFQNGHHLESNF